VGDAVAGEQVAPESGSVAAAVVGEYSLDRYAVVGDVVSSSLPEHPRHLPTLVEFEPDRRFVLTTGRNDFLLPPARYRVELWSQYAFWRVGKATIDIDTTRGPVLFHYAVPYAIYHRGAAGFGPRERAGRTANTVMTVVGVGSVVLAFLSVVLAVLLAFLQ
jgi:hypothetical protein